MEGFIVKENHKFRRPVFSARKGQVEIKGLLSSNIVKINYTAEGWEEEKQQMEKWLQELKGEVLGRNTKCMSKMSEDDTSLEDYERKGRLSGKKLSGAWQV